MAVWLQCWRFFRQFWNSVLFRFPFLLAGWRFPLPPRGCRIAVWLLSRCFFFGFACCFHSGRVVFFLFCWPAVFPIAPGLPNCCVAAVPLRFSLSCSGPFLFYVFRFCLLAFSLPPRGAVRLLCGCCPGSFCLLWAAAPALRAGAAALQIERPADGRQTATTRTLHFRAEP